MPDARTFILPQRAYLLSLRDAAIPARRLALEDAHAAVDELDDDVDRRVAVLGVLGEALQAVEDVAIVASATKAGLPGLPFYVAATAYDPSLAEKFFDKLHKRDEDWFLALAAQRLGGRYVHEGFAFRPT